MKALLAFDRKLLGGLLQGRDLISEEDLNNALLTGKDLGVMLPVTGLVQQMIGSLVKHGKAEDDHSAIVNFLEEMAGVTVKTE